MGRGRPQKYDYEAMATSLFEELVRRPDGMLMEEIIEYLDVPDRFVASRVITTLRLDLGEGDAITVPVIQEDKRHIYKLVGSYDDAQEWLLKRARYMAQRLKTDAAATSSLVRRTDGRTSSGKAARRLQTSASRLAEDADTFIQEVTL